VEENGPKWGGFVDISMVKFQELKRPGQIIYPNLDQKSRTPKRDGREARSAQEGTPQHSGQLGEGQNQNEH